MSCVSTSDKTKQTEYVKQSRINILLIANSLAYIQLFCREGPDAHSGGIGLWYAKHITDIQRWDTQTSADPAHSAVGRCHKWIRAWKEYVHVSVAPTICVHSKVRALLAATNCTKVDVKESCIGPFDQNAFWRSVKRFVHVVDSVSDHWSQSLSIVLHETRRGWRLLHLRHLSPNRHQFVPWVSLVGRQHRLSRTGTWTGTDGQGS